MNKIIESFVILDNEAHQKLLYKFKTQEAIKDFLALTLESAVATELMGIEIFSNYHACPVCGEKYAPNNKFIYCSLDCADAAFASSKLILEGA